MIAAANLTQYPEKRASSFQVSVPCFPKDLNLQAKEPHEIRNDTIRLLVARLCLDCVGCRLGRKTTVDYCLRPGKRSSALDSLYLREHLSTTRRWLDAMWGPSATRFDLTVTGVISSICRHTGIPRRETTARVRASRRPDSSTTNLIKPSAVPGHRGLLSTG